MAGAGRSTRRSRRWSSIERDARAAYGELIAGVDEVGRGPLAGPVVACAVIMPPNERCIAGIDDSKKLSAEERETLALRIRARALAIGLGAASPREIDVLNIYHATTLAMRRALARLLPVPHHVIVDGRPIKALGVEHTAVVGGDGKCYAVACASILAKVTRDSLMRRLAARYPAYDWEHNVGYGTAVHVRALDAVGASPHHRRTFCVKQFVLDFGDAGSGAATPESLHAEGAPGAMEGFDEAEALFAARAEDVPPPTVIPDGDEQGERPVGACVEIADEELVRDCIVERTVSERDALHLDEPVEILALIESLPPRDEGTHRAEPLPQ